MTESFAEYDPVIFQEMLVHPALFTHPKARKIAIVGDQNDGILQEAVKHTHLQEIWHISPQPTFLTDARLHLFTGQGAIWLTKVMPDSLDIIIVADKSEDIPPNMYQQY